MHKDQTAKGVRYTEEERFDIWETQEAIVDAIEAHVLWVNAGEVSDKGGGFRLEVGYGMMQVVELHTYVQFTVQVKCGIE